MLRSSRLRVGVIVDRMLLSKWQADALRTLTDDVDLLVYSCNNTVAGSRRLRHTLYYLVNVFTVRNRMTRRNRWPSDLPATHVLDFDAPQSDGWQELPPDLLEQMRGDRLDAIVKFGMGLLRLPPAEQLPIPILSYHHGNPARYRGRPAGFYEMLADEPVLGQVVQRLSNKLDAGEVAAFAETKVAAHSYRSTLVEAYRQSPLILRLALANCIEGRTWRPEHWGKAYHLPANSLVLSFLLKQWRQAVRRLFYGLFKEKKWNVATATFGNDMSIESVVRSLSEGRNWQAAPAPKGYRFLADPFFHPEGGLLVEGLNSRSCRGEILHLDAGTVKRVSGDGGHYSYPATYFSGEQWHVIPEISEWSPARILPLRENGLGEPAALRIPGRPALLDPTPFQHAGTLYLFANLADDGPSILRLWMADDLHGEFAEHPSSPIRFTPHGSRMAGNIFRAGGSLIRVGQDLRREYGDGLSLFRITQLDRLHYAEELIRDFRFEHCKGPHTLNFGQGRAAFDFYEDRFTPFAGIRRLRERRAAKRSA